MRRKRNVNEEDHVMFLSRFQCCVCKRRGDQIHHLDGDPANTIADNLVFLCLEHHADASGQHPMRRRLSPGALRKYRDEHYAAIARWRELMVPAQVGQVAYSGSTDLVEAAITASALIELARMESDFIAGAPVDRPFVMDRFAPFSKYKNTRIGQAVLEFVMSAAHYTRLNYSHTDCSLLVNFAMDHFPVQEVRDNPPSSVGLVERALIAANAMLYDAGIHLRRFYPVLDALTLVKFLHRLGRRYGRNDIVEMVQRQLQESVSLLDRPDREDLVMVRQLIQEFASHLDDGSLSYPMFSAHIMKALEHERSGSAQAT